MNNVTELNRYPVKATSAGEVSGLIKTLRTIMKDLHHDPETVGKMAREVCNQFGIYLSEVYFELPGGESKVKHQFEQAIEDFLSDPAIERVNPEMIGAELFGKKPEELTQLQRKRINEVIRSIPGWSYRASLRVPEYGRNSGFVRNNLHRR